MNRRTKMALLLGGIAVGGGVIIWRRKSIGAGAKAAGGAAKEVVATVTEQAKEVAATVKEQAKAAIQTVKNIFGGIPAAVIKNFAKYNLASLIVKYASANQFPEELAASITEIESGGDPTRVNTKSGATGLLQILGGKNSRGLSKEQRLDAETSIKTMIPEWSRFLKQAKDAGVTDVRDLYSYVYYGHNQGGGALKAVLKHAGEGFEKALSYYRTFSWIKPKEKDDPSGHAAAVEKHIQACIRVARKVANHALEWAVVWPKVKSGNLAGALGSMVVEPDPTDWQRAPVYDRNGSLAGFARFRSRAA